MLDLSLVPEVSMSSNSSIDDDVDETTLSGFASDEPTHQRGAASGERTMTLCNQVSTKGV